ncbi:uncharacterized protein METZ01_LOCUS61908 [marine metagenome]|uniref:Uncharacterized protein n=1 Tax=marine metagenome TaxID=408172 RepID=A0A381T047_9ZZZZ
MVLLVLFLDLPLVGYLAEYLGLTFNMYLLSVIWGLNGVALLAMMKRIKCS